MKYRIGQTVAVAGDSIDVLLEDLQTGPDGASGVPVSMMINLPTGQGTTPVLIGQPGSFVEIALPDGGSLLCMVGAIRVGRDETVARNGAHGEAPPAARGVPRILDVLAVGTLSREGAFDRGADVLPTIGAAAFAVSSGTIQKIYDSYAQGNFSIGKLSILRDHDAKINLDAFLSRHAAILGQTGAGKSWTVASVIQKIVRFPQSTLVLLDLHGEYHTAFGEYATYIKAADLELPYWLMNCEELVDMCIERTEAVSPLQIAKFKELLQGAKERYRENREMGLSKITVDTPVYFEFKYLLEEMERLDSELVLVNLIRKPGPYYGLFTRIILRLRTRLNDRRFDLIFHPKAYKTSASMETLFRRMLGEEEQPKKLVVLDLSQVPFEVRPSIISLILRCFFEFAYWYKRKNGRPFPVSVFCDEAHTYLNDADPTHKPSRIPAERIAKEGRKYGISLTVISQRPRDVSSTMLSQCNTFLCLRITNPDDQQYVRNLMPDSMKGVMSIISTLRRGEALIVGDAAMMPTRIRIERPNPAPDSSDVSFATEWAKPHARLDVNSVLDVWRNQGI